LSLHYNIWAYGISVSGLKLNESEYKSNSYVNLVRGADYHKIYMTEKLYSKLKAIIDTNIDVKNLYHIAMSFVERNKDIFGYIVSPSSLQQMIDINNYRNSSVYTSLNLDTIFV